MSNQTPVNDGPSKDPRTDYERSAETVESTESTPSDEEVAAAEPMNPPELVEPPTPEPASDAETVVVEPEPASDAPTEAGLAPPLAAAVAPAATTSTSPAAGTETPQVVYVTAPVPPKRKGNRGAGVAWAIVATIVYALVYALVAGLVIAVNSTPSEFVPSFGRYLTTPAYWLPVLAFAVAYVLLVLITNRAGWWAHVLGGFLVAVVVYFSYVVAALLTVQAANLSGAQLDGITASLWVNPLAFAAAIIAREVPIWLGGIIGARGRKVKARNAEAREAFEREQAARQAEYERLKGSSARA